MPAAPPPAVIRKARAYAIAAKHAQLQRERTERQEIPSDELPSNTLEWAVAYRRIEGRQFSLRRFEPNRAAYLDTHPHVVIIKPAQRGWSEYALNATMFALDRGAAVWTHGEDAKDGLNVGYIMPTEKALGEFSKERISSMERESDHLRSMFRAQREFNAVGFKQIGESYLYLRGGQEVNNLTSFPADMIVLDEFDRLPSAAPALARRRMNASVVKREIDLSTPTIPGFGIHAAYMLSDQREYEQPHDCGAWVTYEFLRDVKVQGYDYEDWRYWGPERISVARIELLCASCGNPVSEEQRIAPGRWVIRNESDADLPHGYWAPSLAYPVSDLRAMALTAIKEEPSEIEEFYRSDLGKPYDTGGTRISQEAFQALSAELPNGELPKHQWIRTVMGIDVGARIHYWIMSQSRDDRGLYVRETGWLRREDELDDKMRTFRVQMAVIDALPETRMSDAFVSRWPGRAAAALYPEGALALKGNLYAPDAEKVLQAGRVSINRTMSLDGVLASVTGLQIHWPSRYTHDQEIIEHMTSSQRVTVLDKHGEPRSAWVHTRPDHTFHAVGYGLVARRILTERRSGGGGIVAQAGARDSRLSGR